MKKNYFKVPTKINRIGLPPFSILIYTYMASLPEEANPSLTNICKILRISRPTVVKYIKELTDRNVINQYEKGDIGRVSKYSFTNPKDWR